MPRGLIQIVNRPQSPGDHPGGGAVFPFALPVAEDHVP
jgi:hypothetical protein